jgi:hypothetical protein
LEFVCVFFDWNLRIKFGQGVVSFIASEIWEDEKGPMPKILYFYFKSYLNGLECKIGPP